jgi:hypothetical protein
LNLFWTNVTILEGDTHFSYLYYTILHLFWTNVTISVALGEVSSARHEQVTSHLVEWQGMEVRCHLRRRSR